MKSHKVFFWHSFPRHRTSCFWIIFHENSSAFELRVQISENNPISRIFIRSLGKIVSFFSPYKDVNNFRACKIPFLGKAGFIKSWKLSWKGTAWRGIQGKKYTTDKCQVSFMQATLVSSSLLLFFYAGHNFMNIWAHFVRDIFQFCFDWPLVNTFMEKYHP